MAWITIEKSVGRKGQNLDSDVAKIGAALVAVGPDQGGIYAVPLSVQGLTEAIELFQKVQHFVSRDGKIEPESATLRRINEILDPGGAAPPPVGTGSIRPLTNTAGLAATVNQTTWSPIEASLVSEFVFQWTGVGGLGKISYFELDEKVVPRWYGVLVPKGVTSFNKAHIFFHPTPGQVHNPLGQAIYKDADYQGLGNWSNIFHYLSDKMGSQFCAAGTGRVLIMPLMTQGTAASCGIFPERWESIVGRIFGMLQSGDMSGSARPAPISSVVVSSFSSGITYSHHFRGSAKLVSRLAGVIDLDGGISTFKQFSAMIRCPTGRVVRMQQMPAKQGTLAALAEQNIFPLPRPRWGGPYADALPKNEAQAVMPIHGTIPQTMMFIAARRAG
jgi:hypothetical protein